MAQCGKGFPLPGLPREEVGEKGWVCVAKAEICYSGPFNAVTSFIYYFSFKKKGLRFESWSRWGRGLGGVENDNKRTLIVM